MKRIYAILFLLLVPCMAMAQNKNLTIIGDSRGTELSLAEPSIYDAKRNDVRILAEGALTPETIVNISVPGSTTSDWVGIVNANKQYSSHVTLISIGGNDILHLLAWLEDYKNLHSINEALSWMWQVEIETNFIAQRTAYIVGKILAWDPDNKVILNDVAPVIAYTVDGWHWQYFYLVNYMLTVLNRKYQENIVDNFSKSVGQRIQLLATYDKFLDNILNHGASYYFIGYYSDFIHFGEEGLDEWGRLIATRLGVLGWYDLNNALCSDDFDAPVFVVPPAQQTAVAVPLGASATINVDFQITDNGEILGVTEGGSTVGPQTGNNYRVTFSVGTSAITDNVKIITATDTCGNRKTITLHYSSMVVAEHVVFGWPWWGFVVNYHFSED